MGLMVRGACVPRAGKGGNRLNEQNQRRTAVRNWQKQEAERRRHKLRIALIVLGLLFVFFIGKALFGGGSDEPSETETGSTASTQTVSGNSVASRQTDPVQTESVQTAPHSDTEAPQETPQPDESWKLVLVNATHPLPAGFTVHLKELRNNHQVDERIYPDLQQMFDDARAVEIYPLINESYRTAERQQEILDDYIARYEGQGLSHDDAVKKAHTTVADPGYSEHQLGLALDIVAEYDADSTATWNWLRDNAWRYGFILRYPADKVDITGIDYEPWHFRYVGKEAAKEITERGICLEEYLNY